MRCPCGFTLVELLVVVAIIGILAAVAIPAFMKNAKKAKTAEAVTSVSRMHEGALRFHGDKQRAAGSVRELADGGYIDSSTASAFGVELDEPSLDSPAGGRAIGYLFVYEADGNGQQFTITATPAAPNRSGQRSFSIDKTGILLGSCGPGQIYNPVTGECVATDNFLTVRAVRAVMGLNALSSGRALPLAQQFVKSVDMSKALQMFDANGDGLLDVDELTHPDLIRIGRHLHRDFGKAARPGQREDLRAVSAIVSEYLAEVRDDLAPGIAGAPRVSVPIAQLGGDVSAFLEFVPARK